MCQSQVVGYFQNGDNSFKNPLTGKESENYNFKHLGLRDLGSYPFSRYRDRSIYLRRFGEEKLALAFPRKRWHTFAHAIFQNESLPNLSLP
jgi:hypothetical protein